MTTQTPIIQTVPAYQTRDGEKFHTLEAAQTHAKTRWFEAIIQNACKGHPDYARLDRDLLVKFLFETGAQITGAVQSPLNPAPIAAPAPATKPAEAQPVAQEKPRTYEAAIPAARVDASPAQTVADKLMGAAERGLSMVRKPVERPVDPGFVRPDPGFPPRTSPVEVDLEAELAKFAEEEMPSGLSRGFRGQ